jgi:Tol biopolymer transport system component
MVTNEEQLVTTPRRGSGTAFDGIPSDWSPDGEWVLASSHVNSASTLRLWPVRSAPRAESATKILTSDPDSELFEARYSPDGNWIAFISSGGRRDAGTSIVFVMPSTGAPPPQWTPLTAPGQWADKPRWSADGRFVYYILWEGSFWNVWAVQFDSHAGHPIGAAFPMTHFNSPRHQLPLPHDLVAAEIGVAANHLIVPIVEQTGSIWTVNDVDR